MLGMEKGLIKFAISFLEPGENSEQYGNVEIFVYSRFQTNLTEFWFIYMHWTLVRSYEMGVR